MNQQLHCICTSAEIHIYHRLPQCTRKNFEDLTSFVRDKSLEVSVTLLLLVRCQCVHNEFNITNYDEYNYYNPNCIELLCIVF
jgi:hypothetical protein